MPRVIMAFATLAAAALLTGGDAVAQTPTAKSYVDQATQKMKASEGPRSEEMEQATVSFEKAVEQYHQAQKEFVKGNRCR